MTDERKPEVARHIEQQLPGYKRQVPLFKKLCAYGPCGREFEGTARAKYCCDEHNQAAWRERHAERAREANRAAVARYQARKRHQAKGEG
jgi:hypothetical protein